MTGPINLNKARKAKARVEKKQRTAENRIIFGRTKAEKQLIKARATKAAKEADAHKLD